MSCTSPALKFALLILNILCCLFGILVLSSSTYSLIEFAESEAIRIPCTLEIALSSILFLNSIFGFCTISGRSIRLICIYAFIMLILMSGQIAVIFFQPINFNSIDIEIIEKMWKNDIVSDFRMTMYEIEFKCCGKSGPNDYIEAGLAIPMSCYAGNKNTIEANLFRLGCISRLSNMHSINQKIENASDWTLVAFEGVSAFVAAMLVISLKNIQRRRLYH